MFMELRGCAFSINKHRVMRNKGMNLRFQRDWVNLRPRLQPPVKVCPVLMPDNHLLSPVN